MPHVTTNDGVRLHYVEKGSGAPLVMIPGWSQTAAQFEAQVEGLSASRRVIAFDMRGHGESDKPEHGYKIQRLAMDVRNAIEALGLEQPGLDRVIHAGHRLLGLIRFLTATETEARAWPIREGSTAVEAAGRIHTDFARGFICAETIAAEELIALGGEQAARAAGRMRQEGRTYVVQDSDVIHFRFNV